MDLKRDVESEPINFMESRFHFLSPFSAHRIELWGEVFQTVEHAYQCSRLKECRQREAVKCASSPLAAWEEGQKYKSNPALKVQNFNKEKVMEEIFRAKIAQHPEIVEILQMTGSRGLLKVFADDYYWGTGADGTGQNIMGKLWMKLRDEMQGMSNK
jgi:N-glycosidase YbiA